MPVGNSSNGVGVFPGEVLFTINGNFQHIDWSHDEVGSEPFDHFGTMETYIISPGITIGLTEYFNFNYNQILGIRSMHWGPDQESIHHREESTLTDYINNQGFAQAIGGLVGDARFKIRYLHKNVAMKEGSRIFFGLGMLVPSKSVLTESPFLVNEEDWPEDNEHWTGEHRHFSLSDGAYKGLLEFQLFNKRHHNPVFYGFSANIEVPLSESKYEFMPGISYSFITSLIYNNNKYNSEKNFNFHPLGFSFGLSLLGLTEASWHGVTTPNSESKILVPSFGGIWKLNKTTISISLQKPIFITGLAQSDDDPLNNKTDAIEIVFGYRRNLGYMIPWL